jgi:tRNA G46 methylase TrmB
MVATDLMASRDRLTEILDTFHDPNNLESRILLIFPHPIPRNRKHVAFQKAKSSDL